MRGTPIVIEDKATGFSAEQLPVPEHYIPFIECVMIPNGLIRDRLQQLAINVHDDYKGKKLHILCVLKGGDKVFGDLNKQLDKLNTSRSSVPITYDFIRTSSYENDSSTGIVNIMGELQDIKGRHVLIVEDIVDTGITLKKLKDEISRHEPASLKCLTLLSKRIGKEPEASADYVGFSIPPHFVVGYCLDYNEHFRDLAHICVLNEKGKTEFRKR
ncbi:MAG: hypoxanthine phosphoribosyltransferase [Candidatus Woesearchaeota archaeon]